MITTHDRHPLAQVLDQLGTRYDWLHAELAPMSLDDGWQWVDAATFLEPSSTHGSQYIAERLAQFPRYRRRHAASNLFDALWWPPLMLGTGCFWAAGRVPDLHPENFAYQLDDHGAIERWRLLSGRFAALPSDPAAAHPDCVVVAGRDALRDRLVAQLVAHFARAVALVRQLHPIPERQLWAAASDGVAAQVAWLLEDLGLPDDASAEAEAINRQLPLRGASQFVRVEHAGRSKTFVDLSSCCYQYLQPDGHYCGICPLVPLEQRVAAVHSSLAE